MLDSTRSGMARSSSHLASIYGKDFLELVWDNGQILVQGGSSNRKRKAPSCIGYSISPSRNEEANVWTSGLLDFTSATHRDSHLSKVQDSCQIDLQFSKTESPGKFKGECTNLRPLKDSNKLTGGSHFHQPATTGSSHPCASSSSQQCLASAPLKKPRTDSSQTPATNNSQKQDLGCDQRTGKVNFSNFLIPAVFLKSTYKGNSATRSTRNTGLARGEEIEGSNKVEKAAVAAAATANTSDKASDHSVVIESAKGSHSLTGFQERTAFTANNSNPPAAPLDDTRSEEEPPRDEHSEAALRIHGPHGQYHDQNSSSAALRAEGKANTNFFSNEPMLASSACSLGASCDPKIFGSRKHDDTDDSTYLSDNDEEAEEAAKETHAREGTCRVKRSRNTETHNLSERKRRDKINKKIRALKELIPNCNKMDKASMLDDAIEYLKALKLQLQIMSMGTALCTPFMMLPAAAHHHINTPQLPHQLMGGGMMTSFRPGTGIPFTPPQFPIPPLLPGITADNRFLHQMFGFPNQVPPLPLPISHSPFIPMIAKPPTPTQPQPLMATGTATNLKEHLANFARLTTREVSVPMKSDPIAKDESVTKQSPNQVSLHH